MYILSENLPRREAACVQKGKGVTQFFDLASKEQMYDHARLFSRIVLEPGCSIGYHTHTQETEFYYILKGEALFNDNNEKEVLLHAGDVAATGFGQGHSLENQSQETVELIALIVLE